MFTFKGRLNTDTSSQNFLTTFLANDLTEKFRKSAVASAIAIPLPLCFSCFVPLRRFRENLTKPFYFYPSCTCDSPGGTPSVISLALTRSTNHEPETFCLRLDLSTALTRACFFWVWPDFLTTNLTRYSMRRG